MALDQSIAIAVVLWSLGATVYTWDLWEARGLTDNGWPGLIAMIAGSGMLGFALRHTPSVAVCVLVPGELAFLVLAWKISALVQTEYQRMLRDRRQREIQAAEVPRGPVAGWDGEPGPVNEVRNIGAEPAADMQQEIERSQRLGKMFN
jgi:hypothetical protein